MSIYILIDIQIENYVSRKRNLYFQYIFSQRIVLFPIIYYYIKN